MFRTLTRSSKTHTYDVYEQTSVEFTARVCRSVLKTNVEELTFDNCVVGGTYVKDFTIENYSEMPLSFDITTHQVIVTVFAPMVLTCVQCADIH